MHVAPPQTSSGAASPSSLSVPGSQSIPTFPEYRMTMASGSLGLSRHRIELLAPEFMILWAMRQRVSAKMIEKRLKKYRWGIAHGFFVIMGGFALFDGDKFCGYLWDRDRGSKAKDDMPYDGKAGRIEAYIAKHQRLDNMNERISESSTPSENHERTSSTNPSKNKLLNPSSNSTTPLEFLVYITLTENEIKDRSHADFITKSIAVIQSTWFILQVIALAVEGLVITELEIVTVGFAILNFATYFLWLDKPLRVRHMLATTGGER